MASIILAAAGTAIGGSVGGSILGFSAAAIGGAVGSIAGAAINSWLVASMAPTQRIAGQRLDTLQITASTEGAVIPRVYGAMRTGGNIIWATDFREESRTTHQGGGGKGGGGGGGTEVTEYFYFASLRGRALRGPDHRHRAHLGRRQDPLPRRRHPPAAQGRRDPGTRPVHRGEDGSGEHPGLPRHRLCRLRGAAARALRQPAAAALLRGLPADPRRRVCREPGPRRDADPGLGRVRLCDRDRPARGRRRRDLGGERQRRARRRRSRRRARPAGSLRAEGRVGLARRRLVRRRPARRPLPHPAGSRGQHEEHDAGKLVGERRRSRLGVSRQPRRRRTAPPMAARRPTAPWCRRSASSRPAATGSPSTRSS